MLVSFGVARTQHIYREQSAQNLTEDLGGIFPGGKLIKTNLNTHRFLVDLNRAIEIAKKNSEEYVIIPDVAGYWVQSVQPNPLPVVWPNQGELDSQFHRVVMALSSGGPARTIIVQKVRASELRHGFIPLPDNDPFYTIVPYVRSHFRKVDETSFFELYR